MCHQIIMFHSGLRISLLHAMPVFQNIPQRCFCASRAAVTNSIATRHLWLLKLNENSVSTTHISSAQWSQRAVGYRIRRN